MSRYPLRSASMLGSRATHGKRLPGKAYKGKFSRMTGTDFGARLIAKVFCS